MNTELETTLYTADDKPIYVSGVLIPGMRSTFQDGLQMSPHDDPEVEIIAAVDDDGNDVELTDDQKEETIEGFFQS